MDATHDDPRSSASEHGNPAEQPGSAAGAPDGLADPDAAEQFRQAVEHRLGEPAPEAAGTEEPAPGMEPDEDNPVSVDNPE